ncbi:histidine kinase [Lysinibacillus alkalisoli]|uniref:Histidine kinase n=1 Tax=Lysinibacillus alkalisoli TaxID=1911548 RepID=A0A917G8U1_9BACI|nr:GHKL domain-containing protein [Lysinibacillus alkalisoli]GGG28707.1 histidine kinase [Lysinibacillus alkalisoli]
MLAISLLDFISILIQFVTLIVVCSYVMENRISIRLFLLAGVLVLLPATILFSTLKTVGIMYFIVSIYVLVSIYYRKMVILFTISLTFILLILADHMNGALLSLLNIKADSYVYVRLSTYVVVVFVLEYLYVRLYRVFLKNALKNIVLSIFLNVLSLVIMFGFYYNIFAVIDINSTETTRVNFVLFLLLFILLGAITSGSIYLALNEKNFVLKEREHEAFMTYIETLEKTNEDMRLFRHDYVNILLSLQGYIMAKEWDKLEEYFTMHISKIEQKSIATSASIIDLQRIHIRSIKGLLFQKINTSIEKGYQPKLHVSEDLEQVQFDELALNRILGILWDNAIEACDMYHQKAIEMSIIQYDNYMEIQLNNFIGDVPLNMEEVLEPQVSLKKNHEGVGLVSVKRLVNYEENSKITFKIEDGWFKVNLCIYHKI